MRAKSTMMSLHRARSLQLTTHVIAIVIVRMRTKLIMRVMIRGEGLYFIMSFCLVMIRVFILVSTFMRLYAYTSLCLVSTFYYVFLLSIYLSTCFLIALRLYAYCLPFVMSLCLIVFSFSMQVIQEYEPRQGIFGVLA